MNALSTMSASDDLQVSVELMRERRGTKWRAHGADVIPATIADMDYGVAEPIQKAIERIVSLQDYRYAMRHPDEMPQAAFAERMEKLYGWSPAPERTILTGNLIQAIAAGIISYSEEGDGVVTQTPIYPPYIRITGALKRNLIHNPLKRDGTFAVDMDDLRSRLDDRTRILLLCNPHNPTGRVYTREELMAFGELAVERDMTIITDEIHCDMIYPGHEHIPVATLSDEIAARTVTLNSATKGFNIPALKCGLMHFGTPELLARFQAAVPDMLLGNPNVIGLDATVAAWRDGQPWLDRVMVQLEANRAQLSAWAAQHPKVGYVEPEGTYLAWLNFSKAGFPEGNVQEQILKDARVNLAPGEGFGPEGSSCARLNFATSPEILGELLSRLTTLLARYGA